VKAEFDHLYDNGRARRVFQRRLLLAAVVTLVLFAAVIARAAYLQIAQYDYYSALAEQNRTRVIPLPPERGRIFDTRGRVIADNRVTFQVEIIPEQVRDLDDQLQLLKRTLDMTDEELESVTKRIRAGRKFDPVLVKADLSDEEQARLAQLKPWMPGVRVVSSIKREYPYGPLLAHVVGYVGRISANDLADLDPERYRGVQHIGKSGIERQYESHLHGIPGYQVIEVDALGREKRVIETQPPIAGHDLQLTIDVALQGVATAALREYTGAVVVQDPRDGAIRALVSKPSYDPNSFVDGISQAEYNQLLTDPDRPLYNRAITATYPPGSTIKMLMGLAGMELGLIDPDKRMFAGPYYQLPGHDHRYRDWRRGGHGWVDFQDSIARSVDVYYYDLAHRMGIEQMHTFFTLFGLGERTGLDIPNEARGLVPSPEWKARARGEVWYPGETVIAGIGQGYMLATILQLAQMTSMLATDGRIHQPYLVEGQRQGPRQVSLSDPEYWARVQRSMRAVIADQRGTARRIEAPYAIAGKTGTSQVFSVAQDEEYDEEELERRLHDHALFVGYAPYDDPEISVAVIAEHGGSGSGTAAPIARQIMDYWFGVSGHDPMEPEFSAYGD